MGLFAAEIDFCMWAVPLFFMGVLAKFMNLEKRLPWLELILAILQVVQIPVINSCPNEMCAQGGFFLIRFVSGIISATCYVLGLNLALRDCPEAKIGMMVAIYECLFSGGFTLSPIVGGKLYFAIGDTASFSMLAGFYGLMWLWGLWALADLKTDE